MNSTLNQYFATDKAIFDLMMSGKQRLTEKVLRDLAKERGIFYSPMDSREELIDVMSTLPHDYDNIMELMKRRRHDGRGDKTTSIILNTEITNEEIKKVLAEYAKDVGATEDITHQKKGDKYVANIQYDEFDYSRTQLIQRQRHDAGIEFGVGNGKTTIRLPATEKAQRIVKSLKEKIEGHRKVELPEEIIELKKFNDPEARTEFFIKLISTMEGYRLRDVTNLKVSAGSNGNIDEDEDLDDELDNEVAAAEQEMIGVVKNMALNGKNLTSSDEYQSLRKKGFFITSISWSAEQKETSQDIILFDAAFNDGENGSGFKYSIRGARRYQEGQHLKTVKHVEDHEKEKLFNLLEHTARATLAQLTIKYLPGAGS